MRAARTGSSTVDLTIDDEAADSAAGRGRDSRARGAPRPANWEPGDPFPAPAPAPSGNVNLSTFDGGSPNGTWSLYVRGRRCGRRRQHHQLVALDHDQRRATATTATTATASTTAASASTATATSASGLAGSCSDAAGFYGGGMSADASAGYIAGGYSFSSGVSLNTLYKFVPSTNTWSTLAPFPGSGAIMTSAVYYPTTNKLYVFGGEDAVSAQNFNDTRIYDVASNTWSAGAPMPDVRSFAVSGYNPGNGKIYVVSGYNTGTVDSAQDTTWEYDPVANSWAVKAPIPHAVGGAGAAIINGHMYVAGGRDGTNTVINLCYDYNIAADSWTTCSNLPFANNVPGSGASSGSVLRVRRRESVPVAGPDAGCVHESVDDRGHGQLRPGLELVGQRADAERGSLLPGWHQCW